MASCSSRGSAATFRSASSSKVVMKQSVTRDYAAFSSSKLSAFCLLFCPRELLAQRNDCPAGIGQSSVSPFATNRRKAAGGAQIDPRHDSRVPHPFVFGFCLPAAGYPTMRPLKRYLLMHFALPLLLSLRRVRDNGGNACPVRR
jgi:hypothetical protein